MSAERQNETRSGSATRLASLSEARSSLCGAHLAWRRKKLREDQERPNSDGLGELSPRDADRVQFDRVAA
jgi:hypothetical protein